MKAEWRCQGCGDSIGGFQSCGSDTQPRRRCCRSLAVANRRDRGRGVSFYYGTAVECVMAPKTCFFGTDLILFNTVFLFCQVRAPILSNFPSQSRDSAFGCSGCGHTDTCSVVTRAISTYLSFFQIYQQQCAVGCSHSSSRHGG
jgi:hypothetical protein